MDAKQKLNVLSKISFEVPDNVDSKRYHECIKGFIKSSDGSLFPFGEYCHYIFDFSLDRMVDITDEVSNIFGISRNEILSLPINMFFSEFFAAEHLHSVVNFGKIFFDFIVQERGEPIFINLEVNITDRNRQNKRIILQFRPILYDDCGKPVLTEGYIVDITHVKKEGAPTLTLIKNRKIVATYTGTYEDFKKSNQLPLTKKDIEMLRLRSQGKKIQEISMLMQMKPYTVYSYFRDIKKKTDMEVNALIKLLYEKGLLILMPPLLFVTAVVSQHVL